MKPRNVVGFSHHCTISVIHLGFTAYMYILFRRLLFANNECGTSLESMQFDQDEVPWCLRRRRAAGHQGTAQIKTIKDDSYGPVD